MVRSCLASVYPVLDFICSIPGFDPVSYRLSIHLIKGIGTFSEKIAKFFGVSMSSSAHGFTATGQICVAMCFSPVRHRGPAGWRLKFCLQGCRRGYRPTILWGMRGTRTPLHERQIWWGRCKTKSEKCIYNLHPKGVYYRTLTRIGIGVFRVVRTLSSN